VAKEYLSKAYGMPVAMQDGACRRSGLSIST